MRNIYLIIVSLMALLAAQWWLAERQDGAVFQGALFDSDSYMLLVRVQKLLDAPAISEVWFDDRIDRANTPYGHSLHWTRPLDILLLAGTVFLAPQMGTQGALHQAGVWLSPFLHILTLLTLLWAARALLPYGALFWLGLLFPLQLFLDFQFAPGRPDHHALLLYLFVWAMGAQIRALQRNSVLWAAVTALPLGLMLWVSVEGLLAIALVFAIWGLRWLMPSPTARVAAWSGLAFAVLLTLISIAAVILEHPSEILFTSLYDTISISYIVLLMLTASAFFVAAVVPARWPGLLAFVAVPICQYLIYPAFFHGPLSGQDPIFANAIFQYAGETKGLQNFSDLFLYVGPALVALPYGLWQISRSDPNEARWPWILLVCGLILYLVLAVIQIRWAPYVTLLALPGYCSLLGRLFKALNLNNIFISSFLRIVLIACFALGFYALSFQMRDAEAEHTKCAQDEMARHLKSRFQMPQRIISYMTIGPAILYRSPHEVVATPYFRNAQGGLDTLAFFNSDDPTVARKIIKDRQIDLVLTCPGDRESLIYGPYDLSNRVWLQALELPPALRQWRLYQVRL